MIRAIIFDLDGTLADTEPLHFEAFARVLRAEGIELDRAEYFSRLIGLDHRDCFSAVLRENGREITDDTLAALIERKATIYQEMISGRDVTFPGAADFVRLCAARFPLIVATGTLRIEAELILKRAGVRELFADVIAAEDVEHGKPAPEGFEKAMGRLGFLMRLRVLTSCHSPGLRSITGSGPGPGVRLYRVNRCRMPAPRAWRSGGTSRMAPTTSVIKPGTSSRIPPGFRIRPNSFSALGTSCR